MMNVSNETMSAMTVNYLTVMLLKIAIVLTVIVIFYYVTLLCNRRKNLLHVPGPQLIPIVGNALLFAGDHLHFLPIMKHLIGKLSHPHYPIMTQLFSSATYGPTFRLHLGSRPNLVIASAGGYQAILGSTQHICKGIDYQ